MKLGQYKVAGMPHPQGLPVGTGKAHHDRVIRRVQDLKSPRCVRR